MLNLTIDRRLQGQPNQQEPHQELTRRAESQHFAEHIGGKQNLEVIDRGGTQHNLNSQGWDDLPIAQSVQKRRSSQSHSEQTAWEKSGPVYRKDQQSKARQARSCFSGVELWLDLGLNPSSVTIPLWHCVSHWTSLKVRLFVCKTSLQDCEN